MLHIETFTFNPFSENTYLVYNDDKKAILIDPGCYEEHEFIELTDFISSKGLTLEKIINTHCHIDHVLGFKVCAMDLKVPVLVPEGELVMHQMNPQIAQAYGFSQYDHFNNVETYKPEGKVYIGEDVLSIHFTPGHSPGHVVFYSAESKFVVAGDVLFRESIGRTDLPLGDHDTLMKSIQEVMYQFPDDTIVYCGHGAPTQIGHEKIYNPFCHV